MTRLQSIVSIIFAIFVLSNLVSAQSFTPVLPHSYPLAVRNPYTSTWLPGNQAAHLPSATPQFWSGNGVTWSVLARVDGTAYSLFGAPGGPQAATVLGGAYTSTRSTFTLSAGNALFTLDFLSPVAPNDYVRQSLPFAYLTVAAFPRNGQSASVQIYTDIDDSWLGIDSDVSYNHSTTGATSLFQWVANGQTTYAESQSQQALWGTVVYASQPGCENARLTAATGAMSDVRGQFTSSGSLDGSTPGWASGSVSAFSHDLGSVSSGGSNVTYAIGVARDQAVSFLGADWTHFYRATYADIPSAVDHFLNDYSSASADSQALDAAIAGAANSAAGANYSDIVTLSVRQAYASCDFSISDDSKNTSDPLIFLKEISSDGNVNTVDVLYPIFPIFYVLNAASIRDITEPVIRFLEIGQWNESYACHDIGSAYPVADGHLVGQEFMPVEESANLLILASLYAMSTSDTHWSSSHGSLFRTLGDFLAGNATNEIAQYSSDDGLGPLANQTTLAIKAAVGLNAIGAMFNSNNYTQAGDRLANLLYNQSMGTDAERTHFTRVYPDMTNSWTMAYNMYPDKVLRLNTFPQAAYDMESSYYPTVRATAGVPLDDTTDWAKSDWMMWSGAIASQDTRNMMINDLHQYITTDIDSVPFSDRFFVSHEFGNTTDSFYVYEARPVVGGHFAILALANGANSIASRSSPGSSACAGGPSSSGPSSTAPASSSSGSLVSSGAVTTVLAYTTTTVCPSGQTVTQEGGSTSVLKEPSILTYLATATHVSDTTVFATTFTTDYMTDISYTTVTA
ncbi:MAG: hypothetical protein Q9165_002140 [Trypethelium subeluteriae]